MASKGTLIAIGVVVLLVGAFLLVGLSDTKEECVQPGPVDDTCRQGGFAEVEKEDEHSFGAPLLVGGGVLTIVGLWAVFERGE